MLLFEREKKKKDLLDFREKLSKLEHEVYFPKKREEEPGDGGVRL